MMKSKRPRLLIILTAMIALLFETALAYVPQPVSAADEYDGLREKWKSYLIGGSYSLTDPEIVDRITDLTDSAQSFWTSLNKSATRTYLWSDLNDATTTSDTVKSNNMTLTYQRLERMALAYSTNGSSLYHNAGMLADMISGLDWMNANKFNSSKTVSGNWFDWEIGTPLTLNNSTALLYDQLTATQIANYMNAVDYFNPTVTLTGANRVWESTVIAVRGVIVKDSAKIAAARDGLTNVFANVTIGDGFYADGSFLQHGRHPYTGGYGTSLLTNLSNVIYLLSGSTWQVTTPSLQNMYQWVYKSFEPLVYKGAMMDMVRGREISRRTSGDHVAGVSFMKALLQMTQFAPPADAANYKSMVKGWIQADTFYPFYEHANSIYYITLAKSIMNDSSVAPKAELVGYYPFPAMDRVVQRRPDYSFALSMSSSRIFNYESLNNENLKGWYTGDGMTYLYNQDLSQYSEEYWGLVNKYRLPGTTVDTQTRANISGQGYLSSKNWVGGSGIADTYGAAGMELDAYGNTLTARKSWFMFKDKIVTLGAGITSTDGRTIETTIDNRKIKDDGTNSLTVGGVAKSTTLGWSETMTGVNRVHMQGNVPGSDIGYYFPGGATIKGLRETRTGTWESVNTYSKTRDNTVVTKNFMSLWFDHGANPTGGTYSYVVLPNRTSAQVDAYASNPDTVVLENSDAAQAVRDNSVGVTAMNFWNSVSKTVYADSAPFVTSSTKASVMTLETASDLEVAVSDPTQANTGTIQLEINKAAASVISNDSAVTVTQLQPTIKLTVNVSGAKGKTFRVKLVNAPSTSDLLNENFNGMTTGAAPAGWTISTAGGTVDIVNDPSATNKSMRLADTSSVSPVNAQQSFASTSSPVTAEFRIKLNSTQSLYYAYLMSGTSSAVRIRTYLGNFQVSNGTSYVDVTSYSPNTWYTIKIVANPATDKADVYVDGVLYRSQVNFYAAASSLDGIQFATHSTTANMTFQVDDVRVYE